MKASHSLVSSEALQVLGSTVRAARLQRRWTAAELAERLGVSRPTVAKIERGDPSVAVGTVFEAAALLDVALFEDDVTRDRYGRSKRTELALLPARARRPKPVFDDNF